MGAPVPPRRSRWLLAGAALVVTSVLFLDFCNLMYACGCRSWWAGADALCNIHDAHARHCPWCSIGLIGSSSLWLAIVAAQTWIALRLSGGWVVRALLTFGMFPVLGGVLAVAIGSAQGYWR
jgi:hypothetical protein